MATLEEIRDITFGLWGHELSHQQTIQRLVSAGFPIKGGHLLTMFAIVEGESGEYQRAFHANIHRWPENADGVKKIQRFVWRIPAGEPAQWILLGPDEEPAVDEPVFMKVKSIDLGFCQRSVEISPDEMIEMDFEAVDVWVNGLYDGPYAHLAVPWTAAKDAFDFWVAHDFSFSPWFAWKPDDPKFRAKKRYGSIAITRWIIQSFVGPDPETGKLPRVDFV